MEAWEKTDSQSHLVGIETEFGTKFMAARPSLNRTLLELKHIIPSGKGLHWYTLNRTLLELKPFYRSRENVIKVTLNRTLLELKLDKARRDAARQEPLNRTLLELKRFYTHDLNGGYLLSIAPCWN